MNRSCKDWQTLAMPTFITQKKPQFLHFAVGVTTIQLSFDSIQNIYLVSLICLGRADTIKELQGSILVDLLPKLGHFGDTKQHLFGLVMKIIN